MLNEHMPLMVMEGLNKVCFPHVHADSFVFTDVVLGCHSCIINIYYIDINIYNY